MKVSTSTSKVDSPIGIIHDIINVNVGTDRKKSSEIDVYMLRQLNSLGRFLISDGEYYYFSTSKKILYNIKGIEFSRFLSSFTGLNKKDYFLRRLIESIDTYMSVYGVKATLHVFSYYDKENNELYVYNNNDIIHITEKKIQVVDNGYNDIFFRPNTYSPWEYKKSTSAQPDLIMELIESVNFKKSILSREEIHLVLEYYIFSLFFASLLKNKVILNVI